VSAVAGAFTRLGGPLPRATLAELSGALRQMGPDGEHFACAPGVGMVYRPFHTDGRSRGEPQPLVDGGYLLAFDGRLDNPAEVRRALAADAPKGLSHTGLVLAAYRRWGIAGFARLVGDFALALWDAGEGRLLLCCDALGRRPLYYRLTPSLLLWASRSRALAEAVGGQVRLDEDYVADFLTNRPSSGSPFRGIVPVPGGHVLSVDRASARLERYWSVDPEREIRYRSDDEYEQHFAEVFRDAVACRMPADAPVFCELSGGLDSSSITCVADALLREGRLETPAMHTLSYVFDHSSSSDERAYIAPVEARLGRRGLHVAEEDGPILHPVPDGLTPDFPTPDVCFLARQDFVTRAMERRGARVLLNGMGGDQMFWSEPPPGLALADLLARGHVARVLREAVACSRELRWPYLKTLWMGACWPLLPRWVRARTQRHNPTGEWLEPSFVRRMNVRDRSLELADGGGFRLPSGALQHGLILQSFRAFALEWYASEGYVDVRYPYLDRRLVEFTLAIPFDQKVRPGETRSVVRRALRGVLPEEVRRRSSKAGPSEAFHRALSRQWPWLSGLARDPRVAAHGFVDAHAFANALLRARHGVSVNTAQLLRTLALELWLRTLESSPRPHPGGETAPPGWRQSPEKEGSHVEQADLRPV
jgi:asparagine synthase (glutamine-hydrolysing)